MIKPKTALLIVFLVLLGISFTFFISTLTDEEFNVTARIMGNILPSLIKMILIPIIVLRNNTDSYNYVSKMYSVSNWI